MPTVGEILFDYVLPALIVAAAMLLAWWPRKGRVGQPLWIAAIAINAAWALADCGIGGTPRWPPGSGDASFWLIWFTIPLATIGLLDARLRPPIWRRAIIVALLFGVLSKVILTPLAAHWKSADSTWPVMLGAGSVIWWIASELTAGRFSAALVSLLLAIQFAGAAAVLGISSDVKPSQECVALMGICVVAGMPGWKWREISLARGAALALVFPLAGAFLLVHFYYYTEPPAAAVALILLAPVFVFAADLPPALNLKPRWRGAVRIVAVVLAVAAAAGLSAAKAFAPQAGDNATSHQNDDY